MDEYFIGAGALLTAGSGATIAGATLHAQPASELARKVKAALVDFEAVRFDSLSRILAVVAGWNGPQFHAEVVQRLLLQAECSLPDVVTTLAEATGSSEIHLFAHWTPDHGMVGALARRGVRIVAHPLEALGPAALVSGQRIERWPSAARAA